MESGMLGMLRWGRTVVIFYIGIGGAERLVIDAAMELSRFGYEARVISRLQSLLT